MPVQGLFGTTVELLGKTLDLRAKRQTMISANLANVETPGYTSTDISFEGQLKSALKGGPRAGSVTHPRHIPLKGASAASLEKVQGDVVEVSSRNMAPDGNGVEMETEMGRLAENQIMYNASVQILTKKFEELKQAIRGTL
ncbi:flagellar basal body rod protein FlgB [Geomonas azotofigens]|uniref:flagellar basal body rod protein FlgB n=1 Tax=Geomonas azotofigens TaxID=2843196 RepID=UPI001C128534|nr:flagellar basal body rod protein FlgB [Geomonas azotofigens]MBU5611582.1 flagellar basal body rod protein FlgB [Geomonas azotofigens]